jgi:hypothetical protein
MRRETIILLGILALWTAHATPGAAQGLPYAVTGPASNETAQTLTLTGTFSANYYAGGWWFIYGQNPVALSGATSTNGFGYDFDMQTNGVLQMVTGLPPATTIFYALVVNNEAGTVTGVTEAAQTSLATYAWAPPGFCNLPTVIPSNETPHNLAEAIQETRTAIEAANAVFFTCGGGFISNAIPASAIGGASNLVFELANYEGTFSPVIFVTGSVIVAQFLLPTVAPYPVRGLTFEIETEFHMPTGSLPAGYAQLQFAIAWLGNGPGGGNADKFYPATGGWGGSSSPVNTTNQTYEVPMSMSVPITAYSGGLFQMFCGNTGSTSASAQIRSVRVYGSE